MSISCTNGLLKAAACLDSAIRLMEKKQQAIKCASKLKEAGVIFDHEESQTINELMKAESSESIKFATDAFIKSHKRKTASDLGQELPDNPDQSKGQIGNSQQDYLPIDKYYLNRFYTEEN